MFACMDYILGSPVHLDSTFGWLVDWLVGFGFSEREYHYVALVILEQISCDPSVSASPSARIMDVCHQTQLPCVPVGSQKPSVSVWLSLII